MRSLEFTRIEFTHTQSAYTFRYSWFCILPHWLNTNQIKLAVQKSKTSFVYWSVCFSSMSRWIRWFVYTIFYIHQKRKIKFGYNTKQTHYSINRNDRRQLMVLELFAFHCLFSILLSDHFDAVQRRVYEIASYR